MGKVLCIFQWMASGAIPTELLSCFLFNFVRISSLSSRSVKHFITTLVLPAYWTYEYNKSRFCGKKINKLGFVKDYERIRQFKVRFNQFLELTLKSSELFVVINERHGVILAGSVLSTDLGTIRLVHLVLGSVFASHSISLDNLLWYILVSFYFGTPFFAISRQVWSNSLYLRFKFHFKQVAASVSVTFENLIEIFRIVESTAIPCRKSPKRQKLFWSSL